MKKSVLLISSKAFFFGSGLLNFLITIKLVFGVRINPNFSIAWMTISLVIVVYCLYEILGLSIRILELRTGLRQLDQQIQDALSKNNEEMLNNLTKIKKLKEETSNPTAQPVSVDAVINIVEGSTDAGQNFNNWVNNLDSQDKID